MTSWVARPLVRTPLLRSRRAGLLVAVSLVAAVLALAARELVLAPAPRSAGAPRAALVVDAGGRPHAALSRARAAAGPGVAVRVPGTASAETVGLRPALPI